MSLDNRELSRRKIRAQGHRLLKEAMSNYNDKPTVIKFTGKTIEDKNQQWINEIVREKRKAEFFLVSFVVGVPVLLTTIFLINYFS